MKLPNILASETNRFMCHGLICQHIGHFGQFGPFSTELRLGWLVRDFKTSPILLAAWESGSGVAGGDITSGSVTVDIDTVSDLKYIQ